eukprot:TRINITY_DN2198_c0_g1_i1.p1 TRINITY_DN2198_c0_g1~~TRINITY_DN2198_c0_g1_i1.p1  ORF type:complete len:729 (+),score=199.58 TRINITY_DN2198_c0_g1_i1:69-2255(+)
MTSAQEIKDETVVEDDDIETLQLGFREMDLSKVENASELEEGAFLVTKKEKPKEDDLFATKDSGSGEGVLCVKPWLGMIQAPSTPPKNVSSAPDNQLKLNWAYGYRGYDCTSNIVVNKNGHLVYPAASLVVIYDEKKHTQEYVKEHTDDVVCLAQNPKDKNIVASGQVATLTEGKVTHQATPPHISIYDTTNPKERYTIRNSKVLQRVVRSVAFSYDGQYLAAVGGDDNSTVSVWDWKNSKLLGSMSNKGEMVLSVRWSNKSTYSFVTVGVRHCYQWTFSPSSSTSPLSRSQVKTSTKFPSQTFYSIAYSFDKGTPCVGGRDGKIYFIVNGAFAHAIPAHKGSVFSIDCCEKGMLSGGEDGKVNFYSEKLQLLNSITFSAPVKTVYANGNGVVVGTSKCDIHVVAAMTDKTAPAPVVSGHSDGELWAVCVPSASLSSSLFFSAGEDNTIMSWDINKHKMVKKSIINSKSGMMPKIRKAATMSRHPPNQCVRSISIHPNGKELAVGTNSGELNVYSDDLKLLHSINLNDYGKRKLNTQTQNWIEALSYSPNGEILAVGTHGMVIVLLDVNNNYKKTDILTRHNAALVTLDWSDDSTCLQSTCRAYEFVFHSIDPETKKGKQITRPGPVRDVKWATQTCLFGWPVQGIFGKNADLTDVNTVAASPDKKLLATGDDYGFVNLYRYPCLEGNQKLAFKGHSSHVQRVVFTSDGKYVLSAGGNDKCILQWTVA